LTEGGGEKLKKHRKKDTVEVTVGAFKTLSSGKRKNRRFRRADYQICEPILREDSKGKNIQGISVWKQGQANRGKRKGGRIRGLERLLGRKIVVVSGEKKELKGND